MLSNKALLVYVSISQWTGRKLDRRATETVSRTHATKGHAGNYTKKLLPGSRELDRVSAQANRIRQYFYDVSLPWFSDGARIIKSDSLFKFTSEFRKMKSDFDLAVNEFIKVYPSLQAHAQDSLGSLYSPTDYPNVFRLMDKFQCEFKIMPIADDFRVQVSETEKREYIKTLESVHSTAMQDCWTRLFEVVNKAAVKLADPKGVFHNSLLENVTELCELLPRLNVSDDPTLEAKRTEVESLIAKLSPGVLRDNATVRQDAASKLKNIMDSMGAHMGGSNV